MAAASRAHRNRHSLIAGAARKTAVRILTLFLIAILNPFEIADWSAQRSNDLWQRLHADEYGGEVERGHHALRGSAPTGRDSITIVYFDEASLHATGDTRPLSAFVLGDLIDDIRLVGGQDGAPAAIFVDMLLTSAAPPGQDRDALIAAATGPAETAACAARKPVGTAAFSPFRCLLRHVATLTRYDAWRSDRECQVSTLRKLACIRRAKGLPLLFADPRRTMAADGGSAALDALGTVAATVPVLVEERAYALAAPLHAHDREGEAFRLSPAAALYVLWCQDHPAACPPSKTAKNLLVYDAQGRPNLSDDYDRKLAVIWGVGGPQAAERNGYWFAQMMLRYRGGRQESWCRPAQPGPLAASARLLGLATAGINLGVPDRCPYTQAIPYSLLQSAITQQEARALFGGRMVMIGGQFADSNDVVPAAPFGALPGVYYHAMALDNLIERGPRYSAVSPSVLPWLDVSWADLRGLIPTAIVTFLLAAGARALDTLPRTAGLDAPARHRVRATRVLILCGFVGAVALVFLVFTEEPALIPRSVNLVAVTLLCVLGIRDLIWAAIKPLRRRAAEPGPPIRTPAEGAVT